MKILATADLHGHLPDIPECDLLLVGGDVCPDLETGGQFKWLDEKFRAWLSSIPAAAVVGIAGNHDFVFEKSDLSVRELYLPWHYLQDNGTTVEGVSIWGLPWVPNLPSWAFYGDKQRLDERFGWIPKGVDIVLSHGPPHGYGDRVKRMHPIEVVPHVGSKAATNALDRVKPKAFVCGHIHEAFGLYEHASQSGHVTNIYNVAYVDELYDPREQVIEITI